MKKTCLFLSLAFFAAIFTSCVGSDDGEELTKMIPADHVTFLGKDKQLLKVEGDSVKVMLVREEPNSDMWVIKALVPLSNTTAWNKVPNSKESTSHPYFEPQMGNLHVKFLDTNESELGIDLSVDYDVVESLLSSNEITTANMLIAPFLNNAASYSPRKEIFDQIEWISFSRAELNKITPVKESHNGYDDVIDAYGDAVEDAVDAYEKAAQQAADAYEKAAGKAANEILKSYGF